MRVWLLTLIQTDTAGPDCLLYQAHWFGCTRFTLHSLHPALASPCSRFTLPPHQTCSLTSSDVLLNLWTRHLNPSVRMHSLHPVSSPDVLVNLIRRAFKFMNMSPKARAPRVQVQYCAQILHIPFYPLPPIQEIISVIRGTHSELCSRYGTAYILRYTHTSHPTPFLYTRRPQTSSVAHTLSCAASTALPTI